MNVLNKEEGELVMRIAIFPYEETMKYILKNVSKQYCIQKLISPIGWGYVGNVVETNNGMLMVEKDLGTEINFDCICFVNSTFPMDFESTILPYLEICKKNNFKVMWFRECSKDVQKKLKDIISPENLLVISPERLNSDNEQLQTLYEITTPIIYVADVFPYQNSLYIQWDIYKEIQKRGYLAKLITSKPEQSMVEGVISIPKCEAKNIDIAGYILKFNQLLKNIEVCENPDVFIIGIPGNILEISKKIHGDFGEYTFLLAKSAPPDYLVCNIPYCINIHERYMEIKESVEKNTGLEVDAFTVIPKYLEVMLSEENSRFEYISLPKEFVTSEINGKSNLYESYNRVGICRLVDDMIEKLSDYTLNNAL